MVFPATADLRNLDSYTRRHSVETEDETEALFAETLRAGAAMILNEERTDSAHRAYRPHYQARAARIAELGGDPVLAQHYEVMGPARMGQIAGMVRRLGVEATKAQLSTSDWLAVDAVRQLQSFVENNPGDVLSDEELARTVSAELAEKRKANEAILARGSGVAGFLGMALPLATDPALIPTYALGPGAITGRGIFGNAARAFGVEAGIAFASEIPIQAEVFRFKGEIDSPWSYADAAYNVLAATIGAGAIRATGSVTIDTIAPMLERYAKAPARLKTDETEAAVQTLVRAMDYEQRNPLLGISTRGAEPDFEAAAARVVHQEATARARAQAEAGEPIDVRQVVADVEPLNELDRVSRLELSDVETFAPGELNVDARRFQFKEGGDKAGVTNALEGVTRFDRALAGQILAWQDKGGRLFVVDGHQRVGLANRALAAGQPADEVRLSAFVLREADGITDLDAMRIGAIRNLSATTGSALDAAKVLRGIGPAGEAMLPPLPPNSAMLRQGRFIARLGDDAFNAVVNEVVPARYGAIVGELIGGDAEQLATIDALARLKPANNVQARAMVEQIRAAGFRKETTGDLFGEREIAETLIRERARVIDAALKQARADRATFGRLVARGTDIERVGENVLDSRANRQAVEESGQAIEAITRLANTRGPISDAINKAAREVADGAKPADVIGPILEAIGRAPGGGDTGGRAAGTAGQLDPEGVAINPIDATLEPRAKAEALHVLGAENDDLVAPALARIDAELGTSSKTSFKKIDTILEKVTRPSVLAKRPWFQVENIRDSYRFKTVIEPGVDLAAIGAALARLQEQIPGVQIIKADPSMLFEPKAWGWRAAVYDLQMPNGQLVEWYMPIRELEDAKKARGHLLFERWRDEDLTKLSPEQQRQFARDQTESVELYGAAWDKALARMGHDESAARAAFESSMASAPESIVKDSARSAPVSGVLPELDQTSFSSRAKKPSAPVTSTRPVSASIETTSATGESISRPVSEVQRTTDLLGDDTRAAQALADETARRDAARVAGQESLETGDPGDLFSQARNQGDLWARETVPQAGRPSEGAATGFVPDEEFERVMSQYGALEAELGDMASVARVIVDEKDVPQVEVMPARQVMRELDDVELALNDIEVCRG